MKLIQDIRSHLLWKMLCWFVLLLLLPCLLFAGIYFAVNMSYFQEERAALERSALARSCANIEQDMAFCAGVSKQIQQHSNFRRFLNGGYSSVSYQLEAYFKEFSDMFLYAESSSPYIERVTVYAAKEELLNMNNYVKGISDLAEYAFDLDTAAGYWRYEPETDQLVYRKTIYSLSGDTGLGILEITCSASLLSQPLGEFSSSISRQVLLSYNGRFYHIGSSGLSAAPEASAPEDAPLSQQLHTMPLTVMAGDYLPKDKGNSLNLLSLTAFAGLAVVFLCSLLFFFSISRLSRRIVGFSRHISSSSAAVPDSYVDEGRDELSKLVRDFNRMLERNSDLINQIQLEKLRQNEMAYRVLQAQIDPHFLYNALESVRMMAEMQDEPEISDVIFSLSKLMRYSFSVNTSQVTVESELDLTGEYLKIQKIRLDDQLDFSIHCPPELHACPCSQFILQPLVENAIKYGRSQGHGALRVDIRVYKEQDRLAAAVENNGASIAPAKMARINELLQEGRDLSELSSGTGVGLDSINSRMRYLYPKSFAMKLSRPAEGGTLVQLSWRPEERTCKEGQS